MSDAQIITLTGTLEAGQEAEIVRRALPDHIRLSRAEPGCLTFDVTEDPQIPGLFHVSESFADQAAFDAHQTRTRASPWWHKTQHMKRRFSTAGAA